MKAMLLLLVLLASAGCRTAQVEDNSDAALKARIEAALQGRDDLDLKYVVISVYANVATLSGLVPTREQKLLLRQIVGRTRGVEQLLDNLLVQD